jgi:hypothetical protein
MIPGISGMGSGKRTPEVSLTAHPNTTTSQTTVTFALQSIGAADPERVVVIGIVARNGAAASALDISSVTVGGVVATRTYFSGIGATDGDSRYVTSFYIAAVPSGTTADIVIIFSASSHETAVGVWRTIGFDGLYSGQTADLNPLTLTIPAIPPDALVLSIAGVMNPTGGFTWTGLSEAFDDSTGNRCSGAQFLGYDGDTNLVVGASIIHSGVGKMAAIVLT